MTDDTGALLIDGHALVLEQTRWFPYQVLRRAAAGYLVVETATRMSYGERGLLFQIVVTNNGTASRTFELRIDLSAATSRHDHWGWGIPRDKAAADRFSAVALDKGQALLLRDASNHLANCFGFGVKPDELLVREHSGQATWRATYMSAISLLSVYRTGFPVQRRVYVSNTPESNCTMMYFWDTREWAATFALLDPATLKDCLRSWLARDSTNGYAEEYLTGTLQGPWYSANDYSLFILLDDYLSVTGDRAFLAEKISDQTVLQHMDAIATHWKTLVRPGRTLADYGQAGNLLECVPTYIHEVPSFNC